MASSISLRQFLQLKGINPATGLRSHFSAQDLAEGLRALIARETAPGSLGGSYWAINVGIEPQPVTVTLAGTLMSSSGTGGRTSFSGETAQGQLPPLTGPLGGHISFAVTNLQRGRWRVAAESNAAGTVTCEVSVPSVFANFNATGTGDACQPPSL